MHVSHHPHSREVFSPIQVPIPGYVRLFRLVCIKYADGVNMCVTNVFLNICLCLKSHCLNELLYLDVHMHNFLCCYTETLAKSLVECTN
jgi:hypothetical protein